MLLLPLSSGGDKAGMADVPGDSSVGGERSPGKGPEIPFPGFFVTGFRKCAGADSGAEQATRWLVWMMSRAERRRHGPEHGRMTVT